jgi:hypothetical protein
MLQGEDNHDDDILAITMPASNMQGSQTGNADASPPVYQPSFTRQCRASIQ